MATTASPVSTSTRALVPVLWIGPGAHRLFASDRDGHIAMVEHVAELCDELRAVVRHCATGASGGATTLEDAPGVYLLELRSGSCGGRSSRPASARGSRIVPFGSMRISIKNRPMRPVWPRRPAPLRQRRQDADPGRLAAHVGRDDGRIKYFFRERDQGALEEILTARVFVLPVSVTRTSRRLATLGPVKGMEPDFGGV